MFKQSILGIVMVLVPGRGVTQGGHVRASITI